MANKTIDTEIIVLGAGVVGLTAAIAFARQGRKVVLVDSKKQPKVEAKKEPLWDARIYALTPASVDWLKQINVWPLVDTSRVTAIAGMQLWHADDAEPVDLMADDAHIVELGFIVENRNLVNALLQQITALAIDCIHADFDHITYLDDKVQLQLANGDIISASLLLAADGVNSPLRQSLSLPTAHKSFEQTAIVANFLASKPHLNMARQWFLPHETLALLPLPGQYVSMVWSLPNEAAASMQALDAKTLAARVAEAAKFQLGELELFGDIQSFPLRQVTAKQLVTERVALIGDAAHQIHPMAGQGLNLGLRDVTLLAALVKNAHRLQDIGETGFLRQYERSRKMYITRMNVLTSGLDTFFAFEQPGSQRVAGWGLRQLNKQTAMKKWLIGQAIH